VTERYCGGCRSWYDPKLVACPGCGRARPAYSSHLHTAKLNRHLFGMAEASAAQPRTAPVTSDISYAEL
jgi:hypothetical protein